MGRIIVEAYALAGGLGLIVGVGLGIWISFKRVSWLVWLGLVEDA